MVKTIQTCFRFGRFDSPHTGGHRALKSVPAQSPDSVLSNTRTALWVYLLTQGGGERDVIYWTGPSGEPATSQYNTYQGELKPCQRSIRAPRCNLGSKLHVVNADSFVRWETKQGRLPGGGMWTGPQRMRTLPQSKDEGVGARTFQGEGSFSKMVKVEQSGAF